MGWLPYNCNRQSPSTLKLPMAGLWKRRFMQYRDAAGLSSESETRQVNTLLYCLGEEAKDVLASTDISDEDKEIQPSHAEV